MATHGARKARTVTGNAAGVIGVELLAACQGIDFHAPLRTSPALSLAYDAIRAVVPYYDKDRYFADELFWAQQEVLSGSLLIEVQAELFGRDRAGPSRCSTSTRFRAPSAALGSASCRDGLGQSV